ncbi:hypothetical protein EZI54_20255 [Marinobacter halodurans]|uniref:DUF1127 domain-containing protein n=1 Tax=Marinobacter halodurans TaxID=2528979 RepID=A0ABY1ZJ56_9GAMM|nr:hypothetical protein [Marinobacter halodurans]TBW49107.1 hypothetical protein EZI54_20255 [Marinobacter halodurans]
MQTATSRRAETVFIPPLEGGHAEVFRQPLPLRRRVGRVLREWFRRYRMRARLRWQLRDMDATRAELDVGLPIGSLMEEAYKPFWKA